MTINAIFVRSVLFVYSNQGPIMPYQVIAYYVRALPSDTLPSDSLLSECPTK